MTGTWMPELLVMEPKPRMEILWSTGKLGEAVGVPGKRGWSTWERGL
jgi:hypothetical protein